MKRFPPVPPTGRCVLSVLQGSSLPADKRVKYTELSGSQREDTRQQGSSTPVTLRGNSYYESRFGSHGGGTRVLTKKRAAAASSASPATAPRPAVSLDRFYSGDIMIRRVDSLTPHALRGEGVVDVAGVATSFVQRGSSSLLSIDDVKQSMHLHDGSEIPEVGKGQVKQGKLTVLAVYPPRQYSNRTDVTRAEVQRVLLPVQDLQTLFYNRSKFTFRSNDEALELARVIADRFYTLTRRQKIMLIPLVKKEEVFALQVRVLG
ncbi:hypothetical protein AGDE_07994 [Angomonas deanei]|nr:hypothetical protein AGDE_07994 [Angomonas deanei]|eukprot:EPY34098.1 hypothetical protein AGDE_07994 [Angomonas deanei]